jgi:hypothetical protein
MECSVNVGGQTACVIKHNIVLEEEHDDNIYDQGWEFLGELIAFNPG